MLEIQKAGEEEIKYNNPRNEMDNGEIKISPGTLYGSLSKMEKDGLIKYIKEEDKRKIYCITELGTEVLELEMKRIERLYKNMVEAK